VAKQAQSKSIEPLGSHDIFLLSRAREVAALSPREVTALIKKAAAAKEATCNERPELATQVSLVGSSYKSKHRMTEASWLNRGFERQL